MASETTDMKYSSAITHVGGEVFFSLPNDMYIKLTPEQARNIATKLYLVAADAAGEARPQVIIFQGGSDGE
jgi:hypothetical protein